MTESSLRASRRGRRCCRARARPRRRRSRRAAPSRRRARPARSAARSWLGGCEAIAHCSASAMFDLPEPFGPTTTATPRSKRSSIGSRNDLKPRRRRALRCTAGPRSSTRSSASRAAACSEAFFEGPSPVPMIVVAEHGGGREAAAVRWSGGLHQPVAYGRPLTCQAFLQLRLVVDEALLGVFDALAEGLDDRIGGLAVAVVQEGRADHRLAAAPPARCGSARCASRRRAARARARTRPRGRACAPRARTSGARRRRRAAARAGPRRRPGRGGRAPRRRRARARRRRGTPAARTTGRARRPTRSG